MPEVIDNAKVGVLIKELLKERGMTQEALARELNISKSAVSQNLSGKSTFDIQNLIRISKLFDVSLEMLLTQKSEQTPDIESQYQRMVTVGIEAFLKVPAEDLHIASPDIYGKVLVEYVILEKKKDIFEYLHSKKVPFYQDAYHRTKEILEKIILFSLQEDIVGIERYFTSYAQLFGALTFGDGVHAKAIWNELDRSKHQTLIQFLMEAKVEVPPTKRKIWKFPTRKYLSKKEWFYVISKYELLGVLECYAPKVDFVLDFEALMQCMLEYKFQKGMLWLVEHFSYPWSNMELIAAKTQEILLQTANQGLMDVFVKMVEQKMMVDLKSVLTTLIMRNQKEYYETILVKRPEPLHYPSIARASVLAGNLVLLQKVNHHLTPNDRNFLLSECAVNQQEILLYLIDEGAQFEWNYYNHKTFDKVNKLIRDLRNKSKGDI